MSTPPLSPAGPKPAGWFANRPLTVKFGILVGAVAVSCGGVVGSMLVGNSAVMDIDARSRELNKAEAMVMQLDTRASELKVDGYKALVRSDPEAQLEELAGDIATADELLAVLETAELSGETAEAVDGVVESFGPYTEAIGVFIDSAIADQPGTTARWEEIQVANHRRSGRCGQGPAHQRERRGRGGADRHDRPDADRQPPHRRRCAAGHRRGELADPAFDQAAGGAGEGLAGRARHG
jgi:hypothetical protein